MTTTAAFPRMRGGDPEATYQPFDASTFSPHVRGFLRSEGRMKKHGLNIYHIKMNIC